MECKEKEVSTVPIEDYLELERELELWKELYNNLLKRVSELRNIIDMFEDGRKEE